jgi:hypothetical protein
MGRKERTHEIAAMLKAASIERHRVADFIERQAKCHDVLEGEVIDGGGWHKEMADQLRSYAERIRGGLL